MATLNQNSEVLEGFLCPVCLQDLTSVAQLQVHFEEKHSSEDSAVLNSLKSIFNKAKNILKDSDEGEASTSQSSISVGKIFTNPFLGADDSTDQKNDNNSPWNWTNYQQVPVKSHTSLFKRIRSDRIDASVAETNKLLLRLDKLLIDMPNDPVKRKAHEKNIVPWADDSCVPLCPDCGKSFNSLTRRKHHCRLCGAIMCHNCSLFISMNFAKKLVAPVHIASSMSDDHSSNASKKQSPSHNRTISSGKLSSTLALPSFGLRRSGSQGSLNSLVSVVDALTGEQHFRCCRFCYQRVQARNRSVELRQSKPLLTLLYNKMMTDRETLSRLIPQYELMGASLWRGETVYSLRDATDLRIKLLRLSDSINATTQKIKTLGPVNDSSEQNSEGVPALPSPRQDLLQRRICQTASAFLKEKVLGLYKLPDSEELSELQTKRREEASLRLAAEKEAAELAEQRAEVALKRMRQKENGSNLRQKENGSSGRQNGVRKDSPKHYRPHAENVSSNSVRTEDGWGGDSDAHVVTVTDDPVVQQMNIIRNYIRQAREAHRYDEVSTLERNLKELQEEYRRQIT